MPLQVRTNRCPAQQSPVGGLNPVKRLSGLADAHHVLDVARALVPALIGIELFIMELEAVRGRISILAALDGTQKAWQKCQFAPILATLGC